MKQMMMSAALVLTGLTVTASPADAQTPFTGQIQGHGFNWCPLNWAQTNGQLMAISDNPALYSLLGTNFGGNGTTTYGLPDLRGRRMVGVGTAIGGSVFWSEGTMLGTQTHTLVTSEMPVHSHSFNASSQPNTQDVPAGHTFATFSGVNVYAAPGSDNTFMNDQTIMNAGNSAPFPLVSPYLTINYCIALNGIYPPRS